MTGCSNVPEESRLRTRKAVMVVTTVGHLVLDRLLTEVVTVHKVEAMVCSSIWMKWTDKGASKAGVVGTADTKVKAAESLIDHHPVMTEAMGAVVGMMETGIEGHARSLASGRLNAIAMTMEIVIDKEMLRVVKTGTENVIVTATVIAKGADKACFCRMVQSV